MTECQLLRTAGFTHASSVIAPMRSSELESAMVTHAFDPLKDNPLPNLPATRVADVIVPVFPFPEESVTVVPDTSSKPYPATYVFVVETVTFTPGAGVSRLPLSSTARLLMVAAPLLAGVHV